MAMGDLGTNTGYDFSGAQGIAQGLGNLWDSYQGSQIANNTNQQVQSGIAQNTSTTQAQIDALNGQISTNRQQAQDMYQRSLGDVTGQNQGLEGNIGTMTSNLNSLSDPNSAYMQQARQAIERKDAAAGRRSQWGERETQLAGTLAEYVSKYAPGIQSSITGARDQINRNNQGLASLYSQANAPADRNMLSQIELLRQQLQNGTAANTTGRQAANSAQTQQNSLLQQGIGGVGGLLQGLFGGSSGGGVSNYYENQASQNNGITGYGSGLGNLYGNGGAASQYDNVTGQGYGAMPAGDYFGGGGLGGGGVASYSDYQPSFGGYGDNY